MGYWRLFTSLYLVFISSMAWPALANTKSQISPSSTSNKPYSLQPQETTNAIVSPTVNRSKAVTQDTPSSTQIQLYVPFEGQQLVKALSIKKQVRGLCVGSLVNEHKGAWRCLSAGNVYDPCFKRPNSGYGVFACAQTPWDNQIILLTATDYPNNNNKNTNLAKADPWAIELANHHQCILLTGATGLLHGLRMNYRCNDDSYVLGPLDKTKDLWQAKFHHMKTNKVTPVNVQTAWY
ncbi:MAG: hypothetical protein ACX932_05580 [Gammaproteobacteria bacterium]